MNWMRIILEAVHVYYVNEKGKIDAYVGSFEEDI